MRIGYDYLIAFFDKRGENQKHGRRSTGGYDDLIRRDIHAIFCEIVFTDGLSQLYNPEAVCVVCFSIPDGLVACFVDAFRRIKIRLSNLQMNDILPAPFHLLRLFKDIHNNEGGNFRCSLCNHGSLHFVTVKGYPRFSFPGWKSYLS